MILGIKQRDSQRQATQLPPYLEAEGAGAELVERESFALAVDGLLCFRLPDDAFRRGRLFPEQHERSHDYPQRLEEHFKKPFHLNSRDIDLLKNGSV
ncbi:MAG TPA: hypothetical protein VFN66_10055 [Burkholderiales bacterium]|nr:hypothetical protein [Burkholderiales bacterium]